MLSQPVPRGKLYQFSVTHQLNSSPCRYVAEKLSADLNTKARFVFCSVQLRMSAVNVPLPALLLLRRCCWAPNSGQQSIGISCPSGALQQTRRTLLRRSRDGTDRRADGRTPVCYIDLVPHTMRQCQRYQFPCCKGVQVQYPMRNVGGVLTAYLPPLRREPVGGL